MYEDLGIDFLTAPQAAVGFALLLGAAFGALAEISGFCFRSSLVGDDRRQKSGVWLAALATAILGTQAAVFSGWVDFSDHRFLVSDLPLLAIAIGGVMFGAGMVLTRGCASRLTVLTATGNLRALTVLVVFAITAHATLKGILAPLRTTLGSYTVDIGDATTLAALPGGGLLWAGVIAVLALVFALTSGNRPAMLMTGTLIGALVPLGWVGTGYVLYDDFDPIALESLSFTSTWADTLFWTVAASSIPAGFGTGLIGGTLIGAFLAAALFRRLAWQSFSSPRETGRYLLGATLMGVGGVLAGGCTVGAGLAGIPTLSLAALLALTAIALGGVLTHALLKPRALQSNLSPAE